MNILELKKPSLFEKNYRRITNHLLKILPYRAKLGFTTLTKRIRYNALNVDIREVENTYLKLIRDCADSRSKNDTSPKAEFIMTHDVDSRNCYQSIIEVCDIEKKYGMKSTFNFLTNGDYKIDKKLMMDIKKEGFKIGLHGYDHDLALAYRRPEMIKKRLTKALSFFPFKVTFFRSPALSVSKQLLEVLASLGFTYDSSIPFYSPYYAYSGSIFPYKYPQINITEMPLTLQDDFLFRDCRLNDQEAFKFSKNILDEFIKYNGTFVFNGHPGILTRHLDFYHKFLSYVKKKSQ